MFVVFVSWPIFLLILAVRVLIWLIAAAAVLIVTGVVATTQLACWTADRWQTRHETD